MTMRAYGMFFRTVVILGTVRLRRFDLDHADGGIYRRQHHEHRKKQCYEQPSDCCETLRHAGNTITRGSFVAIWVIQARSPADVCLTSSVAGTPLTQRLKAPSA